MLHETPQFPHQNWKPQVSRNETWVQLVNMWVQKSVRGFEGGGRCTWL